MKARKLKIIRTIVTIGAISSWTLPVLAGPYCWGMGQVCPSIYDSSKWNWRILGHASLGAGCPVEADVYTISGLPFARVDIKEGADTRTVALVAVVDEHCRETVFESYAAGQIQEPPSYMVTIRDQCRGSLASITFKESLSGVQRECELQYP